jgi:hypothetical protein
VISKGMVSQLQHLGDLSDLGFTMGVKGGGAVTPLSAVRPCGRGMPPKGLWTCLEVCI